MAPKTKVYRDLRYKFIRGLIQYERMQRKKNYLKSAAEWTAKAIVSLDLAEEPVKSIKQATQLEGIGGELAKQLRVIEASGLVNSEPPRDGMYCSSAAALLVAMYMAKRHPPTERAEERVLVPEDTLNQLTHNLCEEPLLHVPGGDEKSFCQAWWRLSILARRGFVKKRSMQKETVYELLPEGEVAARRLIGYNINAIAHIAKIPIAKAQQPKPDLQERALYTNDDGQDGIIVLVDTQELGGDRMRLGELAASIGRAGMRYRSQKLRCGDYQWLWRCAGQETTLPVLVERKRADDLAMSLVDGRYLRQKQQMLSWKETFKDIGTLSVVVKYVVEGDPGRFVTQCADGCGGVGKCGYPNVHQLQMKMDEIDNSPEFDLVKTDDLQGTIDLLTLITADLQNRLESGDFDCLLVKRPKPNANKAVTGDLQQRGQEGHPSRASAVDERPPSLPRLPDDYPEAWAVAEPNTERSRDGLSSGRDRRAAPCAVHTLGSGARFTQSRAEMTQWGPRGLVGSSCGENYPNTDTGAEEESRDLPLTQYHVRRAARAQENIGAWKEEEEEEITSNLGYEISSGDVIGGKPREPYFQVKTDIASSREGYLGLHAPRSTGHILMSRASASHTVVKGEIPLPRAYGGVKDLAPHTLSKDEIPLPRAYGGVKDLAPHTLAKGEIPLPRAYGGVKYPAPHTLAKGESSLPLEYGGGNYPTPHTSNKGESPNPRVVCDDTKRTSEGSGKRKIVTPRIQSQSPLTAVGKILRTLRKVKTESINTSSNPSGAPHDENEPLVRTSKLSRQSTYFYSDYSYDEARRDLMAGSYRDAVYKPPESTHMLDSNRGVEILSRKRCNALTLDFDLDMDLASAKVKCEGGINVTPRATGFGSPPTEKTGQNTPSSSSAMPYFAVVKKEDGLDKWRETVSEVKVILPHLSDDVIQNKLLELNGDLESTVSALLDDQ